MKKVLFVGTADNRDYKEEIIEDFKEMPHLESLDGTIYQYKKDFNDLEKNKKFVFKFIKDLLKGNFHYYTVDPSYSVYNKKFDKKDDKNYIKHFSCHLDELNITNDFFDIIIITNCYQNFFDKKNVDKINTILKKKGNLFIQVGVPYYIDKYMKDNLKYNFLEF